MSESTSVEASISAHGATKITAEASPSKDAIMVDSSDDVTKIEVYDINDIHEVERSDRFVLTDDQYMEMLQRGWIENRNGAILNVAHVENGSVSMDELRTEYRINTKHAFAKKLYGLDDYRLLGAWLCFDYDPKMHELIKAHGPPPVTLWEAVAGGNLETGFQWNEYGYLIDERGTIITEPFANYLIRNPPGKAYADWLQTQVNRLAINSTNDGPDMDSPENAGVNKE